MKLTIVGVGLIGGSMSLDLKSCGFADEVYGVDKNKNFAEQALKLGLVDKIYDLENGCKSAEIIILAVPVNVVCQLLPQILNVINPNTTVMDVGSTKANIVNSVKNHPKRQQFVATHPMSGTEFSGPMAAIKELFKHKATILCDCENSAKEHLEKIIKLYEHLQMRVLYMDSHEHDLHTAYVSHLSHISSFVLANTVLDKEKNVNAIFNLASAGFESTVRLAKSSPEMWAPIFEQNHDNVIEALNAYIHHLQMFQKTLVDNDFEATKKLMQRSNEIKRVLEKIQGKKV